MNIQLREYQQQAVDKAVAFLTDSKAKYNGIIVIPTGGGKSWCIAAIADRLDGNVLIFCPSREILAQNFDKMSAINPFCCTIFSASFNSKEVGKITFATIGSAKSHPELFQQFKYIIVDECHQCNPKQGMYKEFFEALGQTKILGLSATPYRLSSYMGGSMLKFLTRTRPHIFSKVIYQVQISTLLDMGFLSNIEYYQLSPTGWNEGNLKLNTTGADYTDKSVIREYERIDFYSYLVSIVKRLLKPKRGGARKGILVFTRFVKEAQRLADSIPNCAVVSGDTPKAERDKILTDFKAKIERELELSDDKRGNVNIRKSQIVESNLPESLKVTCPIFKGQEPCTFEVEVEVNPNDLSCTLTSPEANDIVRTSRDGIINDQLSKIQEELPGLLVIEK